MKTIKIPLLLALAMFISPVMADDMGDVTELTKSATTKIIALLQDDTLADDACKAKVQTELEVVFDLPLTAKLTLGRKYWPRFKKEEQKEFQDLFIKQLVDSYFKKARMFAENQVKYENPVRKKNKIHVAINFTSKGEKLRINNKFYKSRAGWRIYDMEIQDISVVRSYGSQYAEVLRTGTAADLLKKMREKKLDEQQDKK
jgi:phospholipid transport system substrate-binding protein